MPREQSIEKMVKKVHRRMVFWRLMGDLVEVPAHLLKGVAELLVMVANVFMAFSRTVFYMELHYAHQYYNLTQTDLAYALGEPNRYAGMDARRLSDLREANRAASREALRRQYDVDLEGEDE